MSLPEDLASRSLIYAPGLDADEPVLDHIDPADSIIMAHLVKVHDHLNRLCDNSSIILVLHGHWRSVLELDCEYRLLVCSLLRGEGEGVHILRTPHRRILEYSCLMGDMDHVLVLAVRLLRRSLHRDSVLLCVLEHIASALEL